MAGEKTEKATPKRRNDERKKGNIFQSREVVTVFSLIVTFYCFKFLGPLILTSLEGCIEKFMHAAATAGSITYADTQAYLLSAGISFVVAAMPMLLISAAVTVVFTVAQTKGLVSFKSMAPKFNRLNPISGIKKLFSMRGVVELIKSLIKIVVLTAIIYNNLKDKIPLMPRLMDMTVVQAMAFTGDMILSIVRTAAILFVFLALFDYIYQWWDYEKNLRMSKQEIKEEYKESEGDPQIKGKIKERQQQAARKRMMQAVPSADVVIRNPTHYAVAIKYDPDKNNAPVVIAKGADYLALKIIEIAQQSDVTIMENRPLARGLYEGVDLDREIPEKYYQAVAEVLAFVYSVKNKAIT